MVSESSENKKLSEWKASPTGDTIHFAGHTFNLIFLFSFFLIPQLRLEGKKSEQTGPPRPNARREFWQESRVGLARRLVLLKGDATFCDH